MTKNELMEQIEVKEQEIKDLKTTIESLERYKQYETCADEVHAMYQAHVNSGFSDDQAFQLLQTYLKVLLPQAMSGNSTSYMDILAKHCFD